MTERLVITIDGPWSSFSRRTSVNRSPFSSRVLCQDAPAKVRENTTFGMRFIPAATSGIICAAAGVGQKPAIIW